MLGAADEREMPMPLAGILHDRFLALAAQGQGEIDWTAIGLAVAKEAGVGPPSSMSAAPPGAPLPPDQPITDPQNTRALRARRPRIHPCRR